ncbi:MAG: hypothetical protein ACXW27_00270 [Allosphingosinicella sp.]
MKWLETLRNKLADALRVEQPAAPELVEDAESQRDLRTLDFWRDKLSRLPRTIECPEMTLFGTDGEGAVFTGSGRIEIVSDTKMRFYMHAAPAVDLKQAIQIFNRQKGRVYDARDLFRLFATDYRGVKWAGGYTQADFFVDHDREWPLSGEIEALSALASGYWVSKRSSVELLLVPPIDLPMSESLTTKAHMGDRLIRSTWEPGQHTLEVLGTKIVFSYEPSGEGLWITADAGGKLNHPFLENWLTEPLRILLGVPVYPRMVARNVGDGSAHVWLRPSPRQKEPSAIGLLQPFAVDRDRAGAFWKLYADILTLIARAGSFEPHELTRFYDELADSQLGSHWVLTLTLAGAAEGLANGLMTDEDRRSEFSDEHLASMKSHIKAWKDDAGLRSRMLSNLGMVSKRSVVAFMRKLGEAGTVQPDHVQTWYEIRNSVMHGNLVEPWSTEEGDQRLHQMLGLLHDLTRARVAAGR